MAANKVWTWFEGNWLKGNARVIGASDHGAWLGTMVFDGARALDGYLPDLMSHCERVNVSARRMHLVPMHTAEEIAALAREGVQRFPKNTPIYIRPMYWSLVSDSSFIVATEATAFCLVLEEAPLPPASAVARMGRCTFRRPMPNSAPVDAKASCLYANVQRMVREVRPRGFTTALALDQLGNVAEAASANLFLARDGEVVTPMPNGTFLAGITRKRIIALLREQGVTVVERTVGTHDLEDADEIFLTANYSKVTPVVQFEDTSYQVGAMTRLARDTYFDWCRTQS